jgi:hypothetical protein
MAKKFKIAMTGVNELDRELKAIAESEGPKSINKEMRSATREAIKQIVMPRVKSQAPIETGFLVSQLTVRSVRRSRVKLGSMVSFRSAGFEKGKKQSTFFGSAFYAAFLEFGFVHRSGTPVMGDSFLRRPLYESESRVRSHIIGRIRRWVAARNR